MEDDGPLQGLGDLLAAGQVALDDLDPKVVLGGAGEPGADVATAREDEALVGLFQPLQFAHDGADMGRGGDEEDLVVGLDDGVARRLQGPILAVDGRDPGLDLGHVIVEGAQGMANQGATLAGLDRHQSHPPVGEIQHLEAAGVLQQPQNVLGDELLRTDADIDGQGTGGKEFRMFEETGGAYPRDAGGGMEEGIGDLAGDHVGLVAIGDCQDDMGVLGPGPLQHVGMGAMPQDGPKVEAVLEFPEYFGIAIHDRDVVGLARQVRRHGPAYLTTAQDDDLHG